MANTNLLRKLYLFKDLTEKELALVEKGSVQKTFTQGAEIFSQGERAKAMYVIISGSVRVQQSTDNGDAVEVARLGQGAHFGEMAFIDGESRSATTTAVETTELLTIDYDKLSEIFISNPAIATHFYREMALFLCGRLRLTTNDLAFARG